MHTCSWEPTQVLGSGTKPYVAGAVMRLVADGNVSLDDKACKHVDGPLGAIWNTSMVGLFGPMAAEVTVEQMLRHTSGLGDFDEDDAYEDRVLQKRGYSRHDPIEDLLIVADYTAPFGCSTRNCTFVFARDGRYNGGSSC